MLVSSHPCCHLVDVGAVCLAQMHLAGPGSHPGSRADSGDSGGPDARETRAERAAKRAAQRVPGQLAAN